MEEIKCENEYNSELEKCPDCGKPKVKRKIMYFIKKTIKYIMMFLFIGLFITVVVQNIEKNIVNSDQIGEIMLISPLIILMIKRKKLYVFLQEKEKFWKSVKLGTPIILISIISLIKEISEKNGIKNESFLEILILFTAVGIFEEFFNRGLIQNEFIEKFGKNRKKIIASIFFSSLIFGICHITNIFDDSYTSIDVISQIIVALGSGMLLGSIYYRTKNIWACAFLHGFYDFCVSFYETNNKLIFYYSSGSNDYRDKVFLIHSILSCLFYFICAMIILRKSKINKMLDENYEQTEEERKKEKIKNTILTICSIVLLIIISMPTSIFLKDKYTERAEVIQEIEISNYEVHYQHNTEYNIKYIDYSSIYNYESIDYSDITYSFNLFFDENEKKIAIKNNNTNEIVYLKCFRKLKDIEKEDVDIVVLEDSYRFRILVKAKQKVAYILITKNSMSNDISFMEELNKRYYEYPIKNLTKIGYLTKENSNYKYPYMETKYLDKYIFNESWKIVQIKE